MDISEFSTVFFPLENKIELYHLLNVLDILNTIKDNW